MKERTRNQLAGYLFILPSVVFIFGLKVYPVLMTFFYSLTDYNIVQTPVWCGLKNYFNLFNDIYIQASMRNTVLFAILTVPLQTILALLLANALVTYFRGRFGEFLRGAYFVPVLSAPILVGALFSYIFATDNGVVNTVLGAFGIPPVNWLGSSQTALITIGLTQVWKNVGYYLVIFYAGLMDIPRSYYEASEIDGAGKTQQFFRITLPCLKPILYLVVILGMIASFQVFDFVYVMTGGGPGSSTLTMVYQIYQEGFRQYKMGYASAIAVVLLFITALFTLVQRVFFRSKEGEGDV